MKRQGSFKSMAKTDKARIDWIAILRGLTIVLVVMDHVRLLEAATGETYPFIFTINGLFKYLRIPTFIFVSGALLYLSRIRKNWDTTNLYIDKFFRIGFPLIFCTILGCLMQIAFNGLVKHPKEVDLHTFFLALTDYDSTPWPHRWYLMTLLFLMALYPVYLLVLRLGKHSIIAFGLLLLMMYFVDFRRYVDTNWCYFFTLNKYLPFFYLGIVTFKYSLWKMLDSPVAVMSSWGVYSLLLCIEPNDVLCLAMNVCGITAMVSTALLLSHLYPKLFSSFRDYIFPIYLFGIAFQAFIELIVWRMIGCPDKWVLLFYFLNVLTGIYMPVLMCKVVERIPNKWVRIAFGLN